MDWSVILDGFVLVLQVACFVFLAYGFLLVLQSVWLDEDLETGPQPVVKGPADVEVIVDWAHRERAALMARLLARLPGRIGRLAGRTVEGFRAKAGEARLAR